ncbi:MAG: tyrosine-protein phosphatase [Acidimicrobiia bacterium]
MTVPRIVELDGPGNFRDLGGVPTEAGGTVRTGRVYRSDSLSYLSEPDVLHLRDDLGVRTVIDLRAGHEVEDYGHGPLEEHVRQLHMPIVDQTREPALPTRKARKAAKFQTLDQIYGFMLEEYASRFAAVLEVIAAPGNQPVVFHCAAGKDRTGLVSALVLALCGVADAPIVSDFAFTESRMPTIVARHTAYAEAHETHAEVAGQQYGAQAATMAIVLDALRAEHGSVESFVLGAGLPLASVAALRDSLVIPAN